MAIFEKTYKKNISSGKLGRQIWGALLQWRTKPFLAFVFLLTPLSIGLSWILAPGSWTPCLLLLGLNFVVWLTIKACHTLTNIFSLHRKENGITACQIIILAAIGFWIVGFVLIFEVKDNPRIAAAMGVIGLVLGWIFQERVKGVAAFINLRMHHLLNIGDWIMVPKLDVDGQIEKVSLTTITLYNWDTTTSTIPVSALLSEHFINLQHMSEGKTYGRMMKKTFILDTGLFHPISEEEAVRFKSEEFRQYLPEEEIKAGVLNAHLYRLYIYHWLMSHPHISQRPSLVVRWMEQQKEGLPLQVYAFIADSALAPFEWQQSQIIEHVITSMEPFGLRLYQTPSSYDVHHIHLSGQPATHPMGEEL